jgi:hypothetical protein
VAGVVRVHDLAVMLDDHWEKSHYSFSAWPDAV